MTRKHAFEIEDEIELAKAVARGLGTVALKKDVGAARDICAALVAQFINDEDLVSITFEPEIRGDHFYVVVNMRITIGEESVEKQCQTEGIDIAKDYSSKFIGALIISDIVCIINLYISGLFAELALDTQAIDDLDNAIFRLREKRL
jgi:hypothetical protein